MTGNVRPLASWTRACALLALTAAALIAGCRETSAPRPAAVVTLRPNEVQQGSVRPGDTSRFSFRATAGVSFNVAVTALSNAVTLLVRDTTGVEVVPRASARVTPASDTIAGSLVIEPTTNARYDVLVLGDGRFTVRVLEGTPERAPADIVLGRVVDEPIDAPGDVDVFSVTANRGDLLIFHVQALDPRNAGELQAEVSGPADYSDYLRATSRSTDPELETQYSLTFAVLDPRPIMVRVRGDYVGAYRLLVRRVDRLPETAVPVAIENDTTRNERLDYVGDIDDFQVTGPPGALYNVFFRLADARANQRARVDVFTPDDRDPIRTVTSVGTDTSWLDHPSGRFALGADGRATITVTPEGATRGAYELFVYRIDTRPEGARRTLTTSDSVRTEQIDLPGDVDDYALDLVAGDTVHLTLVTPPRARDSSLVLLALFAPDGTPLGVRETYDATPVLLRLTAGTSGAYRVRVDNASGVGRHYRGGYTLASHRFRGAPESGAGSMAYEEQVVESLEPVGDEDHYDVTVEQGDAFELLLASVDLSGDGWFLAAVYRASGDEVIAAAASGDRQYQGSQRAFITQPGRYRVVVRAGERGDVLATRGRYRVTMRRFSVSPERSPATLAPGAVVTNEPIDFPGDVDRFNVDAPPGSYVTANLTLRQGYGRLELELYDPETRTIVARTVSEGLRNTIGRLRIPASGRLLLQVLEPQYLAPFDLTAAYALEVNAINPGPEKTPRVVAIGDTVDLETIEPAADLDEFSFAATAGAQLVVFFDTPDGVAWPGLSIEAVDPRSGEVLAEVTSYQPSRRFGDSRTLAFTIPSSGPYTIRVRKREEAEFDAYRFRFAVVRAP